MTKTDKKELIKLAFISASKSGDPHLKVGAILVEKFKFGHIIRFEGHNNLPKSCKHLGYKDENDKTRPEVIHAEAHALSYLMNNDLIEGKDCQLFCTISPCMECAKSIYLSGIKKIYFNNYYKDLKPLEFLKNNKIKYEQITI
jgi:dCMP deaminase